MKRNKLIYMGWDAPTTAQLRRDLSAMIRMPFDGVVLWAQAKGSDFPAGINTTSLLHNEENVSNLSHL
jgi:hypothetical protein